MNGTGGDQELVLFNGARALHTALYRARERSAIRGVTIGRLMFTVLCSVQKFGFNVERVDDNTYDWHGVPITIDDVNTEEWAIDAGDQPANVGNSSSPS